MNRHEELLAWWELGTELNNELERTGIIDDPLEVQFAVDQLDEAADHLLGTKVNVISPYVEVNFNEGVDPPVSTFHGLFRGTLNGSYYSFDSPKGFLGAYFNNPSVDEDSNTVNYAFVPFHGTTVLPEINASSILHDGLREYIDTLVFAEPVSLTKLVALFNRANSMQNLLMRQATLQYLNSVLPLDQATIKLSTRQAYSIEKIGGKTKVFPQCDADEEISIKMLSKMNKYFKIIDSKKGKQLGILLPCSDSDLFVPCAAILHFEVEINTD